MSDLLWRAEDRRTRNQFHWLATDDRINWIDLFLPAFSNVLFFWLNWISYSCV